MGAVKAERILIIKMSSLGDVLTALPVLHSLRNQFPNAYIAWAIQKNFAAVLPGIPFIDELVFIDRNRIKQPSYWRELRNELHLKEFDLVLDLQMIAKSALVAALTGCSNRYGYWEAREGSGFVSKPIAGKNKYGHIVERLLDVVRYLGVNVDTIEYPLPDLSTAEISVKNKLLAAGCDLPYVVVAPGSRGETKNWPPEYWAELCMKIAADKTYVLIAGAASDKKLAATIIAQDSTEYIIDFTGKTDLRELMALEKNAVMHISSDTGPLHIANATGTSIIGLYGPTRPERSGPYANPRGDVLIAGAKEADLRIKRDDAVSMTDISVEDVYSLYLKKRENEK